MCLPEDDALLLANRLRQAIGDIVRVVRNDTDTPRTAQSETLGLLERVGAMSVAALAEQRKVKHQSMRLVVAQLEAHALVVRDYDPSDRRSQVVSLTDAGRTMLATSRMTRARTLGALVEERLSNADRTILHAAIPIIEKLAAPAD
jgi:DNA-binding MarR family transcriptional regulator